jgi:hypothetical protein
MAFDFSSFNFPSEINKNLGGYLRQFLRAPAPFGQIDKPFQTLMSKPSFMLGPGGSFIDPMQQQNAQATNYLNERGDIASQNLQDKSQAAGLLGMAGSRAADIERMRQMLEAQNVAGQGGGGGLFSALMGGF